MSFVYSNLMIYNKKILKRHERDVYHEIYILECERIKGLCR